MAIHIFLLFYICSLGAAIFCQRNRSNLRNNWIFIFLSFIPIFFIQAMRASSVGVDTEAYLIGYNNINTFADSWEKQTWEKLFVLINIAIGKISNCNEQALLGTISIIIILGIGYFIQKNSMDITSFGPVFFFLTLNHYLTSMVSLRQYCAVAIGINAYTILSRDSTFRGYMKAFFLIMIAFLFHKTALMLCIIPLLFILKKINKKLIWITISGIAIVYFLFPLLLDLAFKLFPVYYRYYEMGHEKFQGRPFGVIYTCMLLLKIMCLLAVLSLNYKREENKELYRLSILSIIGAGISIMTTKVFIVWRLGYYFDVFLIILIPKLLKRFEFKSRIPVNIIFYGWGVMYYFFLLFTNNSGCIPYRFFWS